MKKVDDLKRIAALRSDSLRDLLIKMNELKITKDDIVSMFTASTGEVVAVYYTNE